MNVFEAFSDVEQQNLEFGFVEESLLEHRLETSAVAILVLDQHVIVLRPSRVIANDIVVFTQHSMSVNFVE